MIDAPRFDLLAHPLCLSRPRWHAPSAWVEHVPFAFLLVDLLRPDVLVELGVHTGLSYCAFCQAVEALGLRCRCYGIDTWTGDPHSGPYGLEILAALRRHHDPLYGGFSELVVSTFSDAAPRFRDGEVDFLHIDGYHTYEAVRRDYEEWLPKMSPRGVMVLHDTQVRREDFGVWRLWAELQARYPTFELAHGFGLGVAAVGPACPPGLRALLALPEAERSTLRELFAQLGQRLALAQANHSLAATARRAQEMLGKLIRARHGAGRPAPRPRS